MFNFKFEKILSIKDKLLKKKMLEIASIERSISDLESKLSEVVSEAKKRRLELTHAVRVESLDLAYVGFLVDIVGSLEAEISVIRKEIDKLNRLKGEKIEKAKAINIEKKKFEKLRESYLLRYVEHTKKEEMKVIDEVGVIRHSRSGG